MDETNQLHDFWINVRLSAAKVRSTQSSLECSVVTYAEIATKKKPVFVQANSNSSQGQLLHYITSFCVVFRLSTLYFWLAGKTETKQVVNRMSKWVEGGGSWKGHESGQAVFFSRLHCLFSHANCTRILRLHHSCAWFDKTAMLRKLETNLQIVMLWVSWSLTYIVPISRSPILLTRFKKTCVLYTELSCSSCNL